MQSRVKWRWRVLAGLFVSCLWLAQPLTADEIVAVTDESGRRIFINTGETRSKGDWIPRLTAPAKAGSTAASSAEINNLVEQTASRLQVDPQLVHAIIKVESEYDPNAISNKGAMGLMQLIPETAHRFGVENPFNPKENIEGGVSYLKHLLGMFDGDLPKSLAAYNAGEGAVQRSGGIPSIPETKAYVRKVTNLYQSGSPQSSANGAAPASPIVRYVDERGVVHYTNVE